jgi:hypothetical protein
MVAGFSQGDWLYLRPAFESSSPPRLTSACHVPGGVQGRPRRRTSASSAKSLCEVGEFKERSQQPESRSQEVRGVGRTLGGEPLKRVPH